MSDGAGDQRIAGTSDDRLGLTGEQRIVGLYPVTIEQPQLPILADSRLGPRQAQLATPRGSRSRRRVGHRDVVPCFASSRSGRFSYAGHGDRSGHHPQETIRVSVHGITVQAGSGGTPALTGVVSESVKVRGEALVAKVKDLLHEGTVQRIIVKDDHGQTIIEIPVVAGVVVAVVAPVLTAVAAIAAVASDWEIEIHRSAQP